VAEDTIRSVRLLEVAVPLRVPFTISGGTLDRRRSIVVELRDQAGRVGYGEAAPFELPFYSAETIASVRSHLLDVLVPRVIGSAFADPASLHARLTCNVRGNRMARAAVDTAWWDLRARRRNVSLATLVSERLAELGVSKPLRTPASHVACGAAIGIPRDEDPSLLEPEIAAVVARGFTRIKLKIRPGWSAEPVWVARRVLKGRGISLPMWVDGNGAYRLPDHESELRELDACDLLFVEQPFDEESLWDSVQWSARVHTPLCLDETLVSDEVARQIIAMRGPTIWNLKVQRMGGIEETCRVYARGVAVGAKLWIGTMPETGLGAQAALAFAGLAGCVFPSDLGPSDWWFEPGTDLVDVEMDSKGRIMAPAGPPALPRVDQATVLAEL
jgi:o-succinylbenzoate synthase